MEAKGIRGLTVEEVAREAEFAVGSIYRHFGSKDEMVELLVVHLAEPLCEEVEASEAEGGFQPQLVELIRSLHEHLVEDLPLIQAFKDASGPLPAAGTASGDRLLAVRTRFVSAVDRIVQRGQAEGILAPGEPRTVTLALVGLVSGFVRWSAWVDAEVDDVPERLVRMFLDGARNR